MATKSAVRKRSGRKNDLSTQATKAPLAAPHDDRLSKSHRRSPKASRQTSPISPNDSAQASDTHVDDRESAVRPSAPLGQEPWLDWSPTSAEGIAYQLGRLINACRFAILRMSLAYSSGDSERGDALRQTARDMADRLIERGRIYRESSYEEQEAFVGLRDQLQYEFEGHEIFKGAERLKNALGQWSAKDVLDCGTTMLALRFQLLVKKHVPEIWRHAIEVGIAVDEGIRPPVPRALQGPVPVDEQPGSEPAAGNWDSKVRVRCQTLGVNPAALRSLKMDSPEERRTTVEDLDRMLRRRLDEHASTEPSTTGSGRIQVDRNSGNVIVDGTVYHLGVSDAFELLEGLAPRPGNWVSAKKEIPYFSNIDYRPCRLIPQIREVLGNVIEIESDPGKGVRLILLTPEPVAH